jgi:nucleoside 2-deoxyribosyltransferase
MKIYLAGPMRGYSRNNFPAFDAAAAKLRADGHEVFNPAEHDREIYGEEIEFMDGSQAKDIGFSINDVLKADLSWICDNADCIALLSNWEHSPGAKTEWALAVVLRLHFWYL